MIVVLFLCRCSLGVETMLQSSSSIFGSRWSFHLLQIFLATCVVFNTSDVVSIAQTPIVVDDSAANESESVESQTAKKATADLFRADELFDEENFSDAAAIYRTYLETHDDVTADDINIIDVNDTYGQLALACLEMKDFEQALFALNRLSKSRLDDPRILECRVDCYTRCRQFAPALDELRRLVVLEPNNVEHRMRLGGMLAMGDDMRLRDGDESLSLLTELESQIPEIPMIATLIAAASAENRDFKRAVKVLTDHLSDFPPDEVGATRKEIELYEDEFRFPSFREPKDELLPEKVLALGMNSTVKIHFRGDAVYELTQQGICHRRQIEHDDFGTVIDSRGAILVSSSTVTAPLFKEVDVAPPQNSTWLADPVIEVFSLPSDNRESQLLGNAAIVGIDEETGLAVLQIQHKPRIVSIENLRAVSFQPSSYAQDFSKPSQGYLATVTEIKREPFFFEAAIGIEPPIEQNIQFAVHPIVFNSRFDHRSVVTDEELPISSYCVELPSITLGVGAPVLSSNGECVAIIHRLTNQAGEEKVAGIPAWVASRIASKLLAYGKVNRASLPVKLQPIAIVGDIDGKSSVLFGMKVLEVKPGLLGYEALKGQIIISIDGVPTPTTTDWLIAMERAWSRGRKTAACEITTGLGESVRVAEVYFKDGAVVNLLSPVK